jgi:hypothetical protein
LSAQFAFVGGILCVILGALLGAFGKYLFDRRTAEDQSRRNARDELEKKRGEIIPLIDVIAGDVETLRKTILDLCRLSRKGAVTYDRYGQFVDIAYGLHVAIARYRVLLAKHGVGAFEALRFDSRLYNQHVVLSAIEAAFLADRELADVEPQLDYDPRTSCSKRQRRESRARFVEQRLNPEALLKGMVVDGKIGPKTRLLDEPASVDRTRWFGEVRRLIEPFDPLQTPVFWRILVTQLILCKMFDRVRTGNALPLNGVKLDAKDAAIINPPAGASGAPCPEWSVEEPSSTAGTYLREHVVRRLRR